MASRVSKSDVGSVVGGSSRTGRSTSSSGSFVLKPVEKREGGVQNAIMEALKGGGNVSACSRGGPLSERLCQVCKDVALECKNPNGPMQCPFLAKKIEAHLLSNFPKAASEKDMCDEVVRFVNELAKTDNVRAKQVMDPDKGGLKPTEQRVLAFVKRHNEVQQKLGFCQQNLMQSKTVAQTEKEAPDFLTSIKCGNASHDVAALMQMYKMLEEFQPFLAKAKEEDAEAAKTKDDKRKLMHGNSDIVDKFFQTQKFSGDRAFMKAFLLMSCS